MRVRLIYSFILSQIASLSSSLLKTARRDTDRVHLSAASRLYQRLVMSRFSEGKSFLVSCSAARFCCPLQDLRLPTENLLRMKRNSGIFGPQKDSKACYFCLLSPARTAVTPASIFSPSLFLSLSHKHTHIHRHRVFLSHTFPLPESPSEREVSHFLR